MLHRIMFLDIGDCQNNMISGVDASQRIGGEIKMKCIHSKLLVASCALALISTFSNSPAIATETANVLDPSVKVFGKTLGEWAEKWSLWAYSTPSATNPILDETGAFCDVGQSGGVWFLAGSFFNKPVVPYTRTCTIPRGKYILLPILSGLSFAPEFPENEDPCSRYATKIDQVRCDLNRDVDVKGTSKLPSYWQGGPIVLKLTVDGRPLVDPFAYRVQTSPGGFRFVVRENSILTELGLKSGPREPAVADGYWVMLPPLSPGNHSLRSFVRLEDGRELDVKFILHIE